MKKPSGGHWLSPELCTGLRRTERHCAVNFESDFQQNWTTISCRIAWPQRVDTEDCTFGSIFFWFLCLQTWNIASNDYCSSSFAVCIAWISSKAQVKSGMFRFDLISRVIVSERSKGCHSPERRAEKPPIIHRERVGNSRSLSLSPSFYCPPNWHIMLFFSFLNRYFEYLLLLLMLFTSLCVRI